MAIHFLFEVPSCLCQSVKVRGHLKCEVRGTTQCMCHKFIPYFNISLLLYTVLSEVMNYGHALLFAVPSC